MKNNLAIIESDSVIVSMTRASLALAEAVTVGQTKTLIDVAYAAEIYSKRHHLSDEAIGRALSVKVDATRKLGEILKATPKAKARFDEGSKKVPSRNDAPTLEELGLSKKESAVAQKLADLPEEQFEQVRLGNVTIAKAIAAVDAKPKSTPVAPAPAEAPVLAVVAQEEEYTPLDAAHDQISDLQDALAVATMGEVSEEDKGQAATLIGELRARVKTLEATLKAVTISRDTYMNENAELRKQITRQRKEIDKATGKRTA
jgi:hypothetical protein